MTSSDSRPVYRVVTQTLLAGLVVLLTVPTGVGPAAGGWLAARKTARPARGLAASAVAGLLGALPWATLVYLAASGAIAPFGYHEGPVHVGVNPAAPGLLVGWQEVASALLVGAVLVGTAVAGGILAACSGGTAASRAGEPAR